MAKDFQTNINIGGKVLSSLQSAINSANKAMQSIGKAGKTVATGVGKAMATTGKAVGAMSVAAATGIAAIAKSSVEAYSEYEQLVGGIDTLFKESSPKLQQYASEAYKAAGMSANEYMNTATSFSASLLQSLGNDTAKATEYANQAIIDMSDNANKMGTDIDSIVATYQSLAKGNMGMLDNLKLGYGGTKAEMQRLLKDAEKLSGIKYDISSFSDITQAIHVIQTEMGITGTTAKEASTTIQGSFGMLKSSWENLMTGLADPSQDIGKLITNVVNSASSLLGNVIPVISTILDNVPTMISTLATKITEEIPNIIPSLISAIADTTIILVETLANATPLLINTIVGLTPTLIDAIIQISGAILQALPTIIETLANALPTMIPMLIDGVVSMIVMLCSNFSSIIQPLISALPVIIISIVDALVGNLPVLISGLISLIMGIVSALPQIIQALVDATPTIISMIVQALLNNLPAIIMGLIQVVMGIVSALPQIFNALYIQLPIAVWKGIFNGLSKAFSGLGKWFGDTFGEAWSAVKNVFASWGEFFGGLWNKIKTTFSTLGTSIANAIGGAVKKGINGVITLIENRINDAIRLINGGIDLINKIPGVSVSKVSELKLPRLATGGSFDGKHPQLAIVGDAPETMVPHGNTPRNRALLAEAARGVGGGLFGNVNITFAPVIQGGSGSDVRQALKDSEIEFERKMDEYFRKKGRVSFA